MTLGSLFDGIGGFPLVATWYGITPIWASEIESAPIKITRKHFPTMKHLGDITAVKGSAIEPVDIITFGSPCQGLSIAGKRGGLADERSNLFGEAIRIIKEMKTHTNNEYPKWAVWENVSGALVSNKGLDFRAVLEAFTEAEIPMPVSGRWADAGVVRGGQCDIAWRILDAEYWGVPQRRRRIFLVADFRGQRSCEVLFKPEGLRGDFAQGEAAWQKTAGSVGGSTKGILYLTGWDCQRYRIVSTEGVCPALEATSGGGGHGALIYTLQGNMIGRAEKNGPQGSGVNEDVCFTLNTADRHAVAVCKPKQPIIRLLTPTECERLQGFPDVWTLVGHDGKVISDTARYKALGNSMALPCVNYVIAGIADVENRSVKNENTSN